VIITASLVGALGIATVAAAPPAAGFAVVLLGAALSGAGPGMLNLHSISIRQAITPPTLLGRVNAVVKTISYGATTAGALTGGVAATAVGPRARHSRSRVRLGRPPPSSRPYPPSAP